MRRQKVYTTGLTLLITLLLVTQPYTLIVLAASAPLPQAQHGTPTSPGPDSPADAPPAALAAAAQAGDTIITYAPPKVTLRVQDGYDLDQYLSRSSSPIDFYIDMKGFKAHPTDPTKVTLRVWDVDQAGASGYPQCQVEVDKVYVNGSYLGDLTGANSQWSIVTFSIPANTLNTGSNHFEVQIDTLGTDCWAVQVDWAEIEIPFNIAQIEASATDDITIARGTTDVAITDPVWKTTFDASGNIVTPANPDDAIADKIKGGWFGWGAREFKYKYKLDSWPTGAQPTWEPKVKYSWEILGTSQKGDGELNGWEKDFKITIPDTIGKYTLQVALKIYRENDLVRTDDRTHTLYVIFNTPINTTISGVTTTQPRTAWLDIATAWAAGKKAEVDILEALNDQEYTNPRSWNYHDVSNSPATLIETDGVSANCFVFRDVWRVLAASLGLNTGSTEYRPSNGFMTSTRPALDGNASANGVPLGQASPGNRWVFGNHQMGTYGSNFYDPTYGLKGANTTAGKEANVFCKISGVTPSGAYSCPLLGSTSGTATLTDTGTTYHTWAVYSYTVTTPTPTPTPTPTATPTTTPSPAPRSQLVQPLNTLALTGAGGFTGIISDSGYDADNNGLFEHLQVNAQVDVTQAGTFHIRADLTTPGGDLITLGDLAPDLHHAAPLTSIELVTGVQTIPIYFNGRDIRLLGIDGPYTAHITLLDETGAVLGTIEHLTTTYDHLAFQGLLIQVQSVSDSGVDTDTTPGYNLLRVTVQADILASGTFNVQGQLFANGTFLGNATANASLNAGSQAINLDFAGATIAASALDGPYTVYLNLSDGNYVENAEHTTAAYLAADFQPPSAFFTGSVSDSGQDTNANGLYETLNVVAETVGLVPGNYLVQGILQDSTGNLIATSEVTATLDNTPTGVTLSFDGRAIYRHTDNGPYQVILTLMDADGSELMSYAYMTAAYAYTDFERPGALFNDTFADSGIDTDGDGFYNVLRINVGVEVAAPGVYVIEGSLHDSNRAFITGARTELSLNAGTQTVSLDFDGAAIRTHGVNGPYHLRALELVQSGGGTVDNRLNAYSTGPYAYISFQPAGLLLTGNFTDHGEDTNGNGLFESLVVEAELVIARSDTYYFNARLVDAQGEEIVWASNAQWLAPGTYWVQLRFNGRNIYANGVDGPYQVKDLSIYSSQQSVTLLNAHTTSAYTWNAFEPSGVVSGTVTANGLPVPNTNIFISGVDSDLTNSTGAYRLNVVYSGAQVINIQADPSLSPWQIWVNGQLANIGTSATIDVVVGSVTQVNFISGAAHPPVVEAGGPYTVIEGSSLEVVASGSDPDGRPITFTWDLDNDGIFETSGPNATFSATNLDGPNIYTIAAQVVNSASLTATDQATVTVLNAAPILGTMNVPTGPVRVNTTITVSTTFTDPGRLDTHTALWEWGDGNVTSGMVQEANGSGSISGSHVYTTAGLYTIRLTATDKDGAASQSAYQYVIVYNPAAGSVIGSGWLTSPAGAYPDKPTLTGKAIFAFYAKYLRGMNVPISVTGFQLKAADFTFYSTTAQWLVVTSSKAIYKGSGKVNNVGGYDFLLSVIDGRVAGHTGDTFRLKVWDKVTGTVIYDNQMGAPDDAAAVQALDGGSILIFKP